MSLLVCRPDALTALVDDVYAERALGCVVTGVLAAEEIAAALRGLDGAPRDAGATPSGAYTLGRMLAPTFAHPTGPDFDAYLATAARWDAASTLPIARLDEVMAALAGRPCRVPVAPHGRAYARGTIHAFPDGADAPWHVDNYRVLPCLAHLESIVDRRTQLSWYLPLSLSEEGGELVLERDGVEELHRIDAGSLVLFDGGRCRHRIATCRGPTPRRTFGGFAGRSLDGATLYAWG